MITTAGRIEVFDYDQDMLSMGSSEICFEADTHRETSH